MKLISAGLISLLVGALAGIEATILPWSGSANAQVIPDATLSTRVTTPDNLNFAIDGGDRSGRNLFHSFSQFSVPTGGSASFNNAIDIQNIFARVTGNNISNIDGLLQANGTANLFLLNPNGILFGPNTSLNLGGSLIGTTANSIQFADGAEFSAVNPTPLLTMSVPVGLQVGQNPAAIQVQNTGHRLATNSFLAPYQPYAPYRGLQVQPNQTLALIGGNIDLIGGILQAPGGQIELVSLAQTGLVSLQAMNAGFSVQSSGMTNLGEINLTQQSSIEVGGLTPGRVHLQAGRVNFQEGSLIYNTSLGPQAPATTHISASQSLRLSGAIPDTNILGGILQDNFGPGNGGDITIQTPNLFAESGGAIFSRNYGAGQGSVVNLIADNIQVVGYVANAPDVFSRIGTLTTATGKGGDLIVSTRSLAAKDGGFIGSVNLFDGIGAGNVLINADTVNVEEISPAQISSAIGSFNLGRSGRSGDLTVNTRTLNVKNGGIVGTSSIGAGDAGNLWVNASESIEVSGYGNRLDSYESSLASSVSPPTPIYQQLFGLPEIPSGSGGNVEINTRSLVVSHGGNVNVSNYGMGSAGTLMIHAGNTLVKEHALIGALSVSGAGGNIEIQSNQIVLIDHAIIGATAFGNHPIDNGGNIKIAADVIVGIGNSDIIANSNRGRGGNIDITTQGIFGLKFRSQLTAENDITASSNFGVSGTVQVNTIGVNPSNSLMALPSEVVDPSRQISERCSPVGQQGKFIVTGRGGIPAHPSQPLPSDRPWTDLRTLAVTKDSVHPTMATQRPQASPQASPQALAIVEANALQINASGQLTLIATHPTATPTNSAATCAIAAHK